MIINKKALLYNASILALSNIGLQILGMIYRVFLSRMAGAQGLGVFQLVFSLYPVVMSITLIGLCLAVSRLAAEKYALKDKDGLNKIVSVARKIFLVLFSAVAAIMLIFSRLISVNILGDERTRPTLALILICLLFTGFENIYKSYFYATNNIGPPVFSDILEQIVRMSAVLFLMCYFAPKDPILSAVFIITGMIISELISSSILWRIFKKNSNSETKSGAFNNINHTLDKSTISSIMAIALPVSLSDFVGSLINSAHTIMIPQRLILAGMPQSQAISILGILFGMTIPLLMMPATLIFSLTKILVPKISKEVALRNNANLRRKAAKAIHATGLMTFPLIAFLISLGPQICVLLYKQEVAGKYIISLAFGVVFLYYQITSSGILNGIGMQKRAAVHAITGGIIELIITYFAASDPHFGVNGIIAGFIVSAMAAALMNMRCVIKNTELKVMWFNWFIIPGISAVFSGYAAKYFYLMLMLNGVNSIYSVLIALLSSVIIYTVVLQIEGVDIIRYIKTLVPKNA